MEPAIKADYSPAVLAEAVARFGIDPNSVEPLDGFESYIFRCQRNGQPRVLRISHALRRDANAVLGEIDWINYLYAHGVNVCRAFPSRDGNLVERLGSGKRPFSAALFEMARGVRPNTDSWQPPLFEAMGQMMGRMHALAKTYQPPPHVRRPHWFEDVEGLAEKFIPDQPCIIEKFNALIATTKALPRDRDSYGLVHIDFHGGNFFVENGQIALFDFDDCQYAWFADDIAMCLFYAVSHHCETPEELAFARHFMRHFLQGYRRENVLDPSWLAHIPLFLKRREFDLYIVIHRSVDLTNPDPWDASFLRNRLHKLLNDVPYVDIDFTALG